MSFDSDVCLIYDDDDVREGGGCWSMREIAN